jgi:hypothetical protein
MTAVGGGTLHLFTLPGIAAVNNAGGTISSADAASTVLIDGFTINGGNLTSAAGSAIHGVNGAALNGVTITPGSTYSVDGGNFTYLTGDLINKGTVQVGASGNPAFLSIQVAGGTVNLSGGGTVNLNDGLSFLVLPCQLRRNALGHGHELTRQPFLGRLDAEPVANQPVYLRQ